MGSSASHFIKQSVRLPTPSLTEENLPDQNGRVFIVTGGYAGVGLELSKILYGSNGTVYIAGRSAEKANKAIESIEQEAPNSKGKLVFLELDLSDLATIKPAVNKFLQQERRLDVLVNNAGVMFPPLGSKSTQGHELQIATNCVGPHLLTSLLHPLLTTTAAAAPPRSVRVLWAGSLGVDLLSPRKGVDLDASGNFVPHASNPQINYGASKAGNYLLAAQHAARAPLPPDGTGVVHLSFNPGNLRTELQRHTPRWQVWVIDTLLLFPARFGAYTELWAGWTADLTNEHNGAYVWPWGRFGPVRSDVAAQLLPGGNAERFWAWCDKESKAFT